MKDSKQIRATRGYLARLLTKRERKQVRVLIRRTHKMVGKLPTSTYSGVIASCSTNGETYATR